MYIYYHGTSSSAWFPINHSVFGYVILAGYSASTRSLNELVGAIKQW